MLKFIIYLVYSSKFVIHFITGQAQVTVKDSTDGMFCDIAATGATDAWNIANYISDGCRRTQAGENLQGCWNLGDGAGFLYASSSGLVLSRCPANAGVAPNQSRRLPKEDVDQINKDGRQTDR